MQKVFAEETETPFYLVEQPDLNISSTAIRKACHEGKPIHHMYDESTAAVADYIKKWNLWRDLVDPAEEEKKLLSSAEEREKKEEKETKKKQKTGNEQEKEQEKEKEKEKDEEGHIDMMLEAK